MSAPKSTLDELRIERDDVPAAKPNRWLWLLVVLVLAASIAATFEANRFPPVRFSGSIKGHDS